MFGLADARHRPGPRRTRRGLDHPLPEHAKSPHEHVEQVFHDAIAATGVAVATLHYHSEVGRWTHATDDEYRAFLSELGRDANRDHVRAVASARAAVARAAAYEPSLRRFYLLPVPGFLDHAEEVVTVLRSRLGQPVA